MKVAILGRGVEGQSAAKYWQGLGAEVEFRDQQDGPDYLENLDNLDLIVRSPGIRPDAYTTETPVTSVIAEFLRHCPSLVIGVTGTKGKGTTSSLIAEILEGAGKRVWIGGNIGMSPLDFLGQVKEDHVVVLELSSYQLIDLKQSPHIGVCLMITPEHLNWHLDMDEYIGAKANLFRHQNAGDIAIYKADDSRAALIVQDSSGKKIPYMKEPGAYISRGKVMIDGQEICGIDEVGLTGPHNLENICAAVTATWQLVGESIEPVRQAVMEFTGLPHRLELVREVKGVRYFDDSFATTPETAMAAINSFSQDKVIILGGSDKGADFRELAAAVENGGVIHALLIGDTAPVIAKALTTAGFSHFTEVDWQGMDELVKTCHNITEPGDVVLLSTGCASFGLFENYKDRGDQFAAAVRML